MEATDPPGLQGLLGVFQPCPSLPTQTPRPSPLCGERLLSHSVVFLPWLVDFLPNHFPPGSKLLSGKEMKSALGGLEGKKQLLLTSGVGEDWQAAGSW